MADANDRSGDDVGEGNGKKGYRDNIEDLTLGNTDFRRVPYTGEHLQLVLMTLKSGEEIGEEVHGDKDQFFRFESGTGEVLINDVSNPVEDGIAVIVPAGAKLQAQLFGPSRAIGFVRPGDRVLLRYAAFPYQKFGQYEGSVASISRSAVSPSELPQRLSGLTALYGTDEPLYQIVVDPAHQVAAAYGEAVPLRPGMQLEADVLAETRRLVEWVLDPLFTLTGNWHR